MWLNFNNVSFYWRIFQSVSTFFHLFLEIMTFSLRLKRYWYWVTYEERFRAHWWQIFPIDVKIFSLNCWWWNLCFFIEFLSSMCSRTFFKCDSIAITCHFIEDFIQEKKIMPILGIKSHSRNKSLNLHCRFATQLIQSINLDGLFSMESNLVLLNEGWQNQRKDRNMLSIRGA